MSYFYNDLFLLPFSHDEVVHGKKTIIDKLWGSYEEKFDQLYCLYAYFYFHPGKKLSFMGNELAEFKEWDEEKQLSWNLLDYPAHRQFFRFVQQLDFLYQTHPALWEQDYNSAYFSWLDMGQTQPEIFSLARRDSVGTELILLLNLSNREYRYPSDKIADESFPACNGGFILLPALSCMILEREKKQ